MQDLAGEDFNLKLSMPRLWTDASTAMQNAKRLWAGSSMRHIELATLFVQKFVHQKALKAGKMRGHSNPANCLTKHLDASLKKHCFQELSMVDMPELRQALIDAAQTELIANLITRHNASNTN